MISIERVDPPLAGDEKATLIGFLDYQRDTLRMKTAGLSADQLNATHAPSTMTLGGMLKHLALVEHWWFNCVFLGQEYADTPDELRSLFDHACAESAAIVAQVDDWGTLSVRSSRAGDTFSLRWIVAHMVEEYARHNGHADLLRESIDGETGE